jgi:hypothetical protein
LEKGHMSQVAQTRAMSVRIPMDHFRALEALSYFDQIPVAEQIRQAVASHIEARRRDEAYVARIQQDLDRRRRMIEEFTQHGQSAFSQLTESSVIGTD